MASKLIRSCVPVPARLFFLQDSGSLHLMVSEALEPDSVVHTHQQRRMNGKGLTTTTPAHDGPPVASSPVPKGFPSPANNVATALAGGLSSSPALVYSNTRATNSHIATTAHGSRGGRRQRPRCLATIARVAYIDLACPLTGSFSPVPEEEEKTCPLTSPAGDKAHIWC